MAKVSLRIYNQEIENLVDGGQLDEAIAHCRHVLNTFPKNLETYRLIGKAYLEAKRYNEATDIFERLLMAVPDDFVAHVGMSIINDEQNNMDAAIWYMQRAFEVQPSNAAIQGELQRLYGRRDGIEPPKIRLTRGALAHMYVQGELYPQAISEIKSVLEEDRERHDMQVLLARAYYHSGQKNEAADVCSQLLRRYPYCLDANRVLVELLPETEHGENVQVYRNRVNEMDPYAAYASDSVFRSDEVPDAAVSLERLEWDGQPVDMGPEWGESLGIGRDEGAAPSDEEPDWLKEGLTPQVSPGSFPTDEPAPASGGDDEIPDFLRAAGWGEDTGSFKEGPGVYDASDESPEEPAIAAGDLPDWVKAMAPSEAEMESSGLTSEPGEDLSDDDVPDWLQGLGTAQSTPAAEQPLTTGEDVPDWLESMRPTEDEPSEPSEPEEQPMADVSSSDDDMPDWLKSMQSEEEQSMPEESPQEPAQEFPEAEEAPLSDWQLDEEVSASPAEEPPLAAVEPEGEVSAPVDLPEMSEEESVEPTGEPAVAFDKIDTGSLGTSTEEQDDAMAWLEGLASRHGARPEELVTDPETRKEIEPEWVQKAKEVGAGQPAVAAEGPVEETAAPAEDLPEFLAEEPVEETVAPTEDLPDFLAEELVEETVAPVEELPEFLTEEAGEPAIEPEPEAAFDAIDTGSLGASAEEQDDAMAWLEGLAAKHGAKPEELVTDPEARKETEPEWVQQAKAGAEQVPVAAEEPVEETVASAEDLPEFLAEEPIDEAVKPAGDLPEFLTEKPVEEAVEPAEELPEFLTEETEEPTGGEPAVAFDKIDTGSLGASAEEQDDAMAWLEGLASKHGAKPEELVTDPGTRKETAPEWVQKASQVSAEEPATGEPPAQPPAEEAEPQMPFSEESMQFEDTDETGIWLRDLGEEAGFAEEEGAAQPEAKGDFTDWLSGLEAEEAEQAIASQVETVPEAEAAPESAGEAESDLPDWLRSIEKESPEAVSEEMSAGEREVQVEKIDINTASIDELAKLPGIGDLLAQNIVAQREAYGSFSSINDLRGVAGIGDATIEDLRGLAFVGGMEPEKGADEVDLPSWLAGLEGEAGEIPAEPAAADDLPDWLRGEAEMEPEPAQPESTSSMDWKPLDAAEEPVQAEEAPAPEPEPEVEEQPAPEPPPAPVESKPEPTTPAPPEREAYREPVTRSRSGMTGMLSAAQDPALTQAQNELSRGNIPGAMENYSKLIKKGKMLEEIIFDLREALYRYPVEVAILQTLGDAYMRANRLQEALDSYTKAEELLR